LQNGGWEEIQGVPLATEPGISLIILTPVWTQMVATSSTLWFRHISHTTNVLLFKFRCNYLHWC